MSNVRRWIPVLIVGPILIGAVVLLVLVLRNNASDKARRDADEKGQAIARAEQSIEDLFAPVRFTDAEIATMQGHGTSERGWKKTAALVMAKNPMSLKAFRASRGRVNAFHVFVSIEEIERWGDRSAASDKLLGFLMHEFDGTDAGLAFIDKTSYDGARLFDATKDGARHPVLIALWFEQGHADPTIMFFDH